MEEPIPIGDFIAARESGNPKVNLEPDNFLQIVRFEKYFFREFDPGSGRTLAACLTHAS